MNLFTKKNKNIDKALGSIFRVAGEGFVIVLVRGC